MEVFIFPSDTGYGVFVSVSFCWKQCDDGSGDFEEIPRTRETGCAASFGDKVLAFGNGKQEVDIKVVSTAFFLCFCFCD